MHLCCVFYVAYLIQDLRRWLRICTRMRSTRSVSLDIACGASVHLTGAGGPTYLAIAILRLAPDSAECLTENEKRQTLRWLLQNQDNSGGFRGRTNKDADACYCFWCGGAIQVPSSPTLSILISLSSRKDPWCNGACKYHGPHSVPRKLPIQIRWYCQGTKGACG